MASGPSRIAEAIIAILLPPACREEVLGDLHERYRSPLQYGLDAFCTVPMVIASRIRRTADAQVVTIQALSVYAAFLGAAKFGDNTLLESQWGLLRLAVPALMILLGLILEDAYRCRGNPAPLKLVRGPVSGIGLALLSQALLRTAHAGLELPFRTALYGYAMSLLLTSAVRMLFPPVTAQVQGALVPADWLKRTGGRAADVGTISAAALIASFLAAGVAGTWLKQHYAVPGHLLVVLLALAVILNRARKWR
jgi:hypothetical protein